MRAWMLSSGEYSDYRVHAVFTDLGAAEATKNNANRTLSRYEAIEVEEVELYDAPVEGTTVYDYRGIVLQDGTVTGYATESSVEFPWSYGYTSKRAGVRIFPAWFDGKPHGITVWVVGSDETAVAKSFTDRAAQVAAEWDVTWAVVEAERKRNQLSRPH